DDFVDEVNDANLTDLFIFSHGWNNDRTAAMSLYDRFFAEMSKVFHDDRLPKKNPNARIGVAGVIWPSILWPDDAASANATTVVGGDGGGAVGLVDDAPTFVAPAPSAQEINAELKKAYGDARQQRLVDELTNMLELQVATEEALNAFKDKLAELLASEPTDAPVDRRHPDYAEGAIGGLDESRWRELLDMLGDESARREGSDGGGVGLGDPFKKLWAGAKDALRVATYWQMKQRA